MLYDQFGNEITVKKQPETREIAVTTIRDRWSGYPSQGLTPQTLSNIFKEADAGDIYRQAELFEEMEEKDAHLFSSLQTRKNAILGLDYDLTAWSESAEDKKIRNFVSDCLFGLDSLDDALMDLLDAIGKGYSLCEILWTIDGGRAVIGGLPWIHPKKAVFYERTNDIWAKSLEAPRVITQSEPVRGEILPPFKLVYHRYKARSGYDTRAGILRVCAWMYLFKNYALKDWVAFSEVFGMPLRLGKYDPAASKEDKDALVAAIQSLGSDAAGIISSSTEIEFVQALNSAGTDSLYEALADFCDRQMSKAILGQTATQEGTPGKLGNEDAQDRVRRDLIKADCQALEKTMRQQIIRPLVGYNFGWDKPLPWFKIMFEPPEDLLQLSQVYKNIRGMGQPMSVEHVADRFKIPLPKDGETLLGDMRPESSGKNAPLAARFRPQPHFSDERALVIASDKKMDSGANLGLPAATAEQTDAADVIADLLGEEALGESEAYLAPVRELVESAGSLDELRDGIIDLFAGMDPADLGAVISRALMIAEASGRYEA